MKAVLLAVAFLVMPKLTATVAEPQGCRVDEVLEVGGSLDEAMSCEDWFPMYLDVTSVSIDGTEAWKDSYLTFTEEECRRRAATILDDEDIPRPTFSQVYAECRIAYPDQQLDGGD